MRRWAWGASKLKCTLIDLQFHGEDEVLSHGFISPSSSAVPFAVLLRCCRWKPSICRIKIQFSDAIDNKWPIHANKSDSDVLAVYLLKRMVVFLRNERTTSTVCLYAILGASRQSCCCCYCSPVVTHSLIARLLFETSNRMTICKSTSPGSSLLSMMQWHIHAMQSN